MKFPITNFQLSKGNLAKTKTKNCPANRRTGKILSNTFYRAVCILALFLMAIVFVPTNKPANAYTQADVDNLNTQIAQLQTQLDAKKKDAKTFSDEVAVYDGQINIVQLQINDTQAQIDAANTQITDINGKIAANEAKLKTEKADLNEQLVTIYENSNVTPIELIAGSNSFSDFVDRDEYLQTIQEKTKDTIDTIKGLEKELSDNKNNIQQKKNQIAALQQTQLNQRNELDKQRYGKQVLLNQANQQKGSIQNLIASKQNEANKIRDFLKNPPPPPPETTNTSGGNTTEGSGIGGAPTVTNSTVPSLVQWDGRWAWVAMNDANRPPYYWDGKTWKATTPSYINDFGCGITSLAMIFQKYGYGVSPADIARNPGYFSSGLAWDNIYWGGIYTASGGRFSAQVSWDPGKANSWAHAGKPFIVGVNLYDRYGNFIGNHYVVITGVSGSSWTMNDPLYQGANRLFTYSQITQYVFVN